MSLNHILPTFRRLPLNNLRIQSQRRLVSTSGPELKGAADNAFNRERLAVKNHAAATSDLWRKLSIYATIPCLLIAGFNAYNLWTEHWEHWEHLPPLEERTEYPYQNIRSKNYPWGNGDRTALYVSQATGRGDEEDDRGWNAERSDGW